MLIPGPKCRNPFLTKHDAKDDDAEDDVGDDQNDRGEDEAESDNETRFGNEQDEDSLEGRSEVEPSAADLDLNGRLAHQYVSIIANRDASTQEQQNPSSDPSSDDQKTTSGQQPEGTISSSSPSGNPQSSAQTRNVIISPRSKRLNYLLLLEMGAIDRRILDGKFGKGVQSLAKMAMDPPADEERSWEDQITDQVKHGLAFNMVCCWRAKAAGMTVDDWRAAQGQPKNTASSSAAGVDS